MEKKLKIAIVGAGGIATNAHMPSYQEMENVEIVPVCDSNMEKSKAFAAEFGKNHEEVLEMPGLDAVDIRTPNYLHSIIAVKALKKDFMFSVKNRMQSVLKKFC